MMRLQVPPISYTTSYPSLEQVYFMPGEVEEEEEEEVNDDQRQREQRGHALVGLLSTNTVLEDIDIPPESLID